ncbi:MAG0130/MAG3770 family membrane protein [Mycoplasmopsis primatum]|uniref:MAG0130/MAG3770 family membrane protein n=1 Tax=Mycoplasmopsis primatum TaxID=55604 RepID=UPI0004954933|nr:hypothetical protein [Mycoplasmopsis primatum]
MENESLPINKLTKFSQYSRNKKFLYPVFFIGLIVILYTIASVIALIAYRQWNHIALSLIISLAIIFVLWILLLGPLLQMFNLSFIVFRALNDDSNPWRSKKPYSWILKFQVFFAIYAYNLINKKSNWISHNERKLIVKYLLNQNDDISVTQKFEK